MDAVAVSIASGIGAGSSLRWSQAVRMALVFGAFQAAMPALGWFGGDLLRGWIGGVDHWIALVLLGGLGFLMVRKAWSNEPEDAGAGNPFAWGRLLILALATSIDAAAAGLGLACAGAPLWLSVMLIGSITAGLCLPALWFARHLGAAMATRAEVLGGLVLIAIGVHIAYDHLSRGT